MGQKSRQRTEQLRDEQVRSACDEVALAAIEHMRFCELVTEGIIVVVETEESEGD